MPASTGVNYSLALFGAMLPDEPRLSVTRLYFRWQIHTELTVAPDLLEKKDGLES